ncbi:MAG: alpha amylase C-terminal domain-containing protein [Bacteroidales bacterium]|nr:alpha amylase C-terminal domain-containing protein [Bacteroidales bacterium]
MTRNIRLTDDPYLTPYLGEIEKRKEKIIDTGKKLTGDKISLKDFASAHEYYGLHSVENGWVFREWAPNAQKIYMIGDFSGWGCLEEFRLERMDENGDWELRIDKDQLHDQDLYRLKIFWDGGEGDRIPAYARRVVQDEHTKIFNAQVWTSKYEWQYPGTNIRHPFLKIYEAHIGMSSEEERIATYDEFRENVLPRIVDAGYNTIQLMAVQEHPYYGSFGYHVANFFAPSSRFGTPQQLKRLIDEAHRNNVAVIMDLVHSHSVKNEVEGLSKFDGTDYQYFHTGDRGYHEAWDSRCFDYGRIQVLHFLLSNCRYWLDEFNVDGFRFDGITSMLYLHHGVGYSFGSYDDYFNRYVDTDAYVYLSLANKVIHEVTPTAVTLAEDISGMPGLVYPTDQGGAGFDDRQAMGVSDYWFKMLKDMRDEDWSMDELWHELTNKRPEERTVSYVECHDQALVGGKTLMFELADKDMYTHMHKNSQSITIDRAVALHKMARLATFGTADSGYLNFMGNEFGHPEWVDFPREGNNWSYKYSRRQWSLRNNEELIYHDLGAFDRDMMRLNTDELANSFPSPVYLHNHDKLMAFTRGRLLFLFNFHPAASFSDYMIPVDRKGIYRLIFDSDRKQYSGFARISPHQEFHTQFKDGDSHTPYIKVYLPSRVAMVLKYSSE